MQHHAIPTSIRLALVAGGITLLAGACAASTVPSASRPAATAPTSIAPTTTVTPVAATEPMVEAATPVPTTEPMVEAATPEPEPVPNPQPEPEQEPDADGGAEVAPEPVPACGDYGPLPALPDSMPTHLYDTDADGQADDEVTAYGAADGWRVRLVQDGVISEVLVDDIAGWAYLDDPIVSEYGHLIVLVEPDTNIVRYLGSGLDDCVRLLGWDTMADEVASPDDDHGCGGLAPIPDDATVASELWRDIDNDDIVDERIVAYFDGTWKLRGEVAKWGVSSELEIPDAGPHGVRIIGFADVDHTYGGEELLAVVGGGASAVEVGVFSFHEGYCMFRYQHENGGDFGLLTGASVMWGQGIVCADGEIGEWGYQLADDDTYTLTGVSYEPVSLGVFGYVPASDSYVEGLTIDEISDNLFDCYGLEV